MITKKSISQVCQKCFTRISRGKPHESTVRNKIENILNAAGEQREQIAARILTDKLNNTPATTNDIKSTVLKRSRGHSLNISVLSKKAKIEVEWAPPINIDVLKNIQMDTHTNTNQVKTSVKNIKNSTKKKLLHVELLKNSMKNPIASTNFSHLKI